MNNRKRLVKKVKHQVYGSDNIIKCNFCKNTISKKMSYLSYENYGYKEVCCIRCYDNMNSEV